MELSEFSKKYIETLDRSSARYNQDIWWATFLGSRHRFYSGTYLFLQILKGKNISPAPNFFSHRFKLFFRSILLLLLAGIKKLLLTGKLTPDSSIKFDAFIKSKSYTHSYSASGFIDPFLGELNTKIKNELTSFTVVEHLGPFFKDLKIIRQQRDVFNIYQFLNYGDLVKIGFILFGNLFRKKINHDDPINAFIESNFH